MDRNRHEAVAPPSVAALEQDADTLSAQGWVAPLPAIAPKPTYWPAVLGVGIAFLAGGLATYLILSAAGLAIVIAAAIGWIHDLVLEYKGAANGE